MTAFTKELYTSTEKRELAEKVLMDIRRILFRNGLTPAAKFAVITPYLLFKAATGTDPVTTPLTDLIPGLQESEELSYRVQGLFREKAWEELKALTTTCDPEILMLAALIDEDKADGFFADLRISETVTKIAETALGIKKSEAVADISCTYGEFITEAISNNPDTEYTMCAELENYEYLSRIKAELLGGKCEVLTGNSFELPVKMPEKKFDKIFSSKPLGIPASAMRAEEGTEKWTVGQPEEVQKAASGSWLEACLAVSLLKENGKAAVLVTKSDATNARNAEIRKYLAENGLIEAVIVLPEKLLRYTNISTSLVILSHGNEKIRLVDATELYETGRRFNEMTEEHITAVAEALKEETEHSRDIDLEILQENNYTFLPERYKENEIYLESAVPLGSVCKEITRSTGIKAKELDTMITEEDTGVKFIQISDLNRGLIKTEDLPNLSGTDEKLQSTAIKDNSIVMQRNGFPVKTAVIEDTFGEKIIPCGNMLIIEPDEEKILPYYIRAFFESEMGAKLLAEISQGATIPNISKRDLEALKIPLLPMKQQKKIADSYKTSLEKIKMFEELLTQEKENLKDIFRKNS